MSLTTSKQAQHSESPGARKSGRADSITTGITGIIGVGLASAHAWLLYMIAFEVTCTEAPSSRGACELLGWDFLADDFLVSFCGGAIFFFIHTTFRREVSKRTQWIRVLTLVILLLITRLLWAQIEFKFAL